MTIEAPKEPIDMQPSTTREEFLSSSAQNCYYSESNFQFFFNLHHRAPSRVGDFSLLFNDPQSHIAPPYTAVLVVTISNVQDVPEKVAVIAHNERHMRCTTLPQDQVVTGFERDFAVEQQVCELISKTKMVVPSSR